MSGMPTIRPCGNQCHSRSDGLPTTLTSRSPGTLTGWRQGCDKRNRIRNWRGSPQPLGVDRNPNEGRRANQEKQARIPLERAPRLAAASTGTEAQLSRGGRLKTKNCGHLKEKLYEIRRPIIEASTSSRLRPIAVSYACIGATLSTDKSSTVTA
jgi:hypothetical protein